LNLSTSQRIGAGTPTPPPKTIGMWGMSPVPQPRVPSGATLPGSPESTAAASVRASMAMSKSHPIVTDDALDMPAPARGKKGIIIAAVAAAAVIGGALFFLKGGSSGTPVSAPAAVAPPAPAAVAPPAAPAPAAAVVPAAAAPAVKPAAAAPAPEANAAPEARAPEATAARPQHESKSDGKGKGKSKPHGHGKETHGGPAAKPAAGVPVID
jgi:hypothetical protein